MKLNQQIGELKINFNTNISLWQAIKLRIAGKNYKDISNKICDLIEKRFNGGE